MKNVAIAVALGDACWDCFIIFILHMMDNTFKKEEDIEKHLRHVGVLGIVPVFEGEERGQVMLKKKSLITINDPKAAASEAYRMVRTNIEFSNVDDKKKTIVFTSAKQKEGKSTTIANTAIAMAHSGSKVLLIDCDLRKPRVHKLFQAQQR